MSGRLQDCKDLDGESLLEQFPRHPLIFLIDWDQKEKMLFERVEGKIRMSE